MAFHAPTKALRNTDDEFHKATNIAINAATPAMINSIGASIAAIATPIASNTGANAEATDINASITVPAPVNTLINVPIKSITPKIGGPSVMNTPANVAINPNNIPIAGCASVNLAIKSVIAIATSKTAAASGAIAVPTFIMIWIILPSSDINLGPFVLI